MTSTETTVAQSKRLPLKEPPYSPEQERNIKNNTKFKGGLSPLNLRLALANHVPLGTAFQEIAHKILFESEVNARYREIAIIRTGALTRCEYEWGMHVSIFAEKCSLDSHLIQELTLKLSWHDFNEENWSKQDLLTVRMTDELHRFSTISDETWTQMTDEWPMEQVIELIMASGVYHMASFFLNSASVPLEVGQEHFPEGISQAEVG